MNPSQVYVEIVGYDERIEKRMGPMSAWQAEKVERGAEINLNHEKFYIRQVPADPAQEREL